MSECYFEEVAMTQWSDKFKSHQLWQHLQELGPAIDSAFNVEGVEPETLDGLARLKSILSFTGRRLSGADPYLIQVGPFDALGTALQNMIQEVQSFIADGNVSHIATANSHGDTALTYLAQINVPLTTEDFMAAKESAATYRTGLETALRSVTATAEELDTQIDALKTRTTAIAADVEAEHTRLTGITTDFQSQFTTDQEQRTTTFSSDQKEREEKYSSLIADYTQKLTDQQTEFTTQREAIAKNHQAELADLKKQFADEAKKLHEEILHRKTEVEQLVGVIGNLGVTSGYLTTANKAKESLRMWQLITVGAMLVLIAIAFKAFLPAVEAGFTWTGFAGRVFVTLTVGALAAYAGTQADKYMKMERYNRRMALELEAIGPFIAPLTTDQQADFRIKLGERSFGHSEATQSHPDVKSPTNVAELLTDPKFRTLIADFVKAVKP